MSTDVVFIVLSILFLHWLFDFVFQTDWQAQNKSSNNAALLAHTSLYSFCWIVLIAFLPLERVLIFMLITFICHTITDYFTSRLTKKLFGKKDYHNGFCVIGFDQLTHFAQLFITYHYLAS